MRIGTMHRKKLVVPQGEGQEENSSLFPLYTSRIPLVSLFCSPIAFMASSNGGGLHFIGPAGGTQVLCLHFQLQFFGSYLLLHNTIHKAHFFFLVPLPLQLFALLQFSLSIARLLVHDLHMEKLGVIDKRLVNCETAYSARRQRPTTTPSRYVPTVSVSNYGRKFLYLQTLESRNQGTKRLLGIVPADHLPRQRLLHTFFSFCHPFSYTTTTTFHITPFRLDYYYYYLLRTLLLWYLDRYIRLREVVERVTRG